METLSASFASTGPSGGPAPLEEVTKKIRLHCLQHRIRILQFLHDFDKARSGRVSRDQFQRALHMSGLSGVIAATDYESIFDRYEVGGRVNYTAFCEDVDEVFTKKRLEKNPMATTSEAVSREVLSKPQNSLTAEEENIFQRVQQQCVDETRAHGLVLKSCFIDFDTHRCGKVPHTQFERAMPFKLARSELDVVIKKYRDNRTRHVNYLEWITDIDARVAESSRYAGEPSQGVAVGRRQSTPPHSADSLLAEIRKQVKQRRIRIADSMADYDKLHTGFITPDQFRSCLGGLKLHNLFLSDRHLQVLCDRYAKTDAQGFPKIAYTHFIDGIDEVFAIRKMEKDPGITLQYTAADFANVPQTHDLASGDEVRVESILARIRQVVQCRRIHLKPAFQDFDRASKGVYQTRSTSKKRFERVLAIHGIHLTDEEYSLLEKKYESNTDPGSVNYVLFCSHLEDQAVVKAPVSQTLQESPLPKFVRTGKKMGAPALQEVVDDIRTQVLTQRIRINEFLRDYDKLRAGTIMREQFASGLCLAKIEVDQEEVDLLCHHFAAPNRPGHVRWTEFCDEVDAVTTMKGLETKPLALFDTQAEITHRRHAEREPRHTDEVLRIIAKLREVVRTRGVLLPPFFKDFDTHNVGQITANRMGQSLTRHEMGLSQAEIKTICEAYLDPRTRDVCYRKLIADVDDTENASLNTLLHAKTLGGSLGSSSGAFGSREIEREPSLEEVLNRLRSRVVKDSIRLRDFFVDADKLRKGSVPASKFRTGIDIAGLRLGDSALQLLEQAYAAPLNDDYVDYVRFCQDVDPSASKACLEKVPSRSTVTYKPLPAHPLRVTQRPLEETTRAQVAAVLDRLRVLTSTRRVLIKPTFLDFDKIRKGTVSRHQFAAALDKLQLRLRPEETQRLIERFEVSRVAWHPLPPQPTSECGSPVCSTVL